MLSAPFLISGLVLLLAVGRADLISAHSASFLFNARSSSPRSPPQTFSIPLPSIHTHPQPIFSLIATCPRKYPLSL
ncbi:hypothetical protein F4861DRAFT_503370 [Xylaria intraflava]|nr:hypothetical protein F4861DRAFT_503370 [Xylaria intraflava]